MKLYEPHDIHYPHTIVFTILLIIIPVIFIASFFANAVPSPTFNDVPNVHPNYEAIEYARANEIIHGFSDGTFKPDHLITRGEFTKIVILSRYTFNKVNGCGTTSFPDVSHTNKFSRHICVAFENSIINGYSDGLFHPEYNITSAEAAKIIAGTLIHGYSRINEESYTDTFQPYIEALERRRVMPATISYLDKPITRGEMVEMIFRIRENITNRATTNFYFNQPIIAPASEEGGPVYPTWTATPTEEPTTIISPSTTITSTTTVTVTSTLTTTISPTSTVTATAEISPTATETSESIACGQSCLFEGDPGCIEGTECTQIGDPDLEIFLCVDQTISKASSQYSECISFGLEVDCCN